MLVLNLCGHDFHYEMENLCRVFYPDASVRIVYDSEQTGCVTSRITREADGFRIEASFGAQHDTLFLPQDTQNIEEEKERLAAITLYHVLSRTAGYAPPWGILTGVRPSKLMNTLIRELGAEGAEAFFREKLLVTDGKTRLTAAVAAQEARIMHTSRPDSFSLYISIPFCPSRCSYCSFVSHSISTPSARKLVEPYVELLEREIAQCGSIADALGLHLETIYIGGGTPTSLSAPQLSRLCSAVAQHFLADSAREFTVEAGRPDTITREKLLVLREAGVTRVSINPQTLNDDVLERIGRRHTAAQALDCFRTARDLGFGNINMDLIAGLDGDTPESFARTLDGVLALSPENVTVHTLALKRASRLVTQENASSAAGGSVVGQMLETVLDRCTQDGYTPYYMYRQSRSVGNFENVGWCRPGFEGLYNIFMMEEVHTVLACGAGAVTKLRNTDGKVIERIFNFKYPYEYISRFDELTERKERIKSFYAEYPLEGTTTNRK